MKRNSSYDVALDELKDTLSSPTTPEGELDAKTLAELLNQFLDGLSEENRVIFMRRYWFSDTCAQIGERVGLTEKNVSVRLARTRKRLRDYLKEKEVPI